MIRTVTLLISFMVCSAVHAFGLSFGSSDGSGFSFGNTDDDSNSSFVSDTWELLKAGKSAYKGFDDLTPEQEHYLGRATAANLLSRFEAVNQEDMHRYLNQLVNYLAIFSDRPTTFAGYRVQVIRSGDASAYSTPGGFILISETLLKKCNNEDELAAVLAHEIAHVARRHGMSAIQKANLNEAGTILGKLILKDQQELLQTSYLLGESFGASVEDIVKQLIDSGYSESQEEEADNDALQMLSLAGYDPHALSRVIENTSDNQAINKTHPGGKDRIHDHKQAINKRDYPKVVDNPKSLARFNQFIKK